MLYEVQLDYSNYLQPSPHKIMDEYCDEPYIFQQVLYLCDPGPKKYVGDWKKVKIQLEPEGSNLLQADISGLMGKLFFSDKVLERLKKSSTLKAFFENSVSGELIEVFYEHNNQLKTGFFFNPLVTVESKGVTVDSLEDEYANILSVSPRAEHFSELLFKTEENLTAVYCTETFKAAIEEAKLTGLIFKPVESQTSTVSIINAPEN